MQHALLILGRERISAIRLPDGSLTLDAIAALAHFPSIPRNPSVRLAPTPERVAKLNELLAAGKVSDRNARRLVNGDRISDTPWLVVVAIAAGTTDGHADIDLVQPERQGALYVPTSHVIREVCWRARLWLGTGEVSTNFDPLTARSTDLPPEPLLLLLDELGQEGWRIVHTSEDRTVTDATSSVIAIRYLLTRD